jgi:glycosyltransferase involved in cell wall biosynthesis
MTTPLVSVKVAAFNQERYIAAALAGILAQRTTFPFEVIVGEDGSTDGTPAIVARYAETHPGIVRVLPAEGNLGPMRNIARIRAVCRGDYEAICEGDDIWIDPGKLQRQVEFLEAHPDCMLCFHDVLFFRDDRGVRPRYFCPHDLPEFPTMADVLQRPVFIHTCSVVTRRALYDTIPAWRNDVLCGDLVVRLWGPHVGRIGFLKDSGVMAVHRRHGTGLSMQTGHRRMAEEGIKIYRLFDAATGGRYSRGIRERIAFERQYIRWGPLCYAWHPIRALHRIQAFRTGAGI